MAQWVEHWPADLVVLNSFPDAEIFFNRKLGSNAYSLSLSPVHHPDMPEILLKWALNCKSSIHL